MTNEEIKLEKEKCFAQIKSAEKRLKEIRKTCKHETLSEVRFSFRIGNIQLAEVCEDCGEFIRYV